MKTVFVHGAPNGPDIWNRLIAELGLAEEDCLPLALPGFSVPCPKGFEPTRDAYANWLVRELEDTVTSTGKPVRIVGHDFGAIFTLRACSLRPDLISSWAAFGSLIDSETKPHAIAKMFRAPLLGELLSKVITNRTLVAAGLRKQGLPAELAEQEAARIGPQMCQCVLALYRTPYVAGEPHPWADNLANLPDEGLLIWGAQDPYVSAQAGRRFAERWGYPLHIEPDTGHWPFVQNPRSIADRLQEFWAKSL